jgi:hypothetical protein
VPSQEFLRNSSLAIKFPEEKVSWQNSFPRKNFPGKPGIRNNLPFPQDVFCYEGNFSVGNYFGRELFCQGTFSPGNSFRGTLSRELFRENFFLGTFSQANFSQGSISGYASIQLFYKKMIINCAIHTMKSKLLNNLSYLIRIG